jgi:deoxyribodipyrimidine photo-lyase
MPSDLKDHASRTYCMSGSTPINIVWFKRDLRVTDHAPLVAASSGPVLPVYIFEPDYWQLPDTSPIQHAALVSAVSDLSSSLLQMGAPLLVQSGKAIDVFKSLLKAYPVAQVVSHEETGNAWTYDRDRKVARFLKASGIPWVQYPSNGVIRRLGNRDGWSKRWHQTMHETLISPPSALTGVESRAVDSLSVATPDLKGAKGPRLIATRATAMTALSSFLQARGERYHTEMSSPLSAEAACSRLSVPLSLGLISIREVYQQSQTQAQAVKADRTAFPSTWPKALQAFGSRLRWHCHFIQKLEDEPQIEFNTMHPAYESVRSDSNADRLQAWQEGCTGYPMVDACMRYLKATGWLNFRMRAMLVSFASYHLWLDWRVTAPYLASLFADYEPGIHYSQVQMQSGTTGMNAVRIYNPIKQGLDHDPEGLFIRQWVPELAHADHIHEPWKHPNSVRGYPAPIVSESEARRSASSKIYALRRSDQHREQAKTIVAKHGSRSARRFGQTKRKSHVSSKAAITATAQGSLALDP